MKLVSPARRKPPVPEECLQVAPRFAKIALLPAARARLPTAASHWWATPPER